MRTKYRIVSFMLALVLPTLVYAQGIRFEKTPELQGSKGLTKEQKDNVACEIERQVQEQRRKRQNKELNVKQQIDVYNALETTRKSEKRKAEEIKIEENFNQAKHDYELRYGAEHKAQLTTIASRSIMSEEHIWAADVKGMLQDMSGNSGESPKTPVKAMTSASSKAEKQISGKGILANIAENEEMPESVKKQLTFEEYMKEFQANGMANFTEEDLDRFNAMMEERIKELQQ